MGYVFGILMAGIAIFLILLVLVQRGRGGGLSGALGGMGGSSAFGAKAGDVFTRITIVTATIWIITCLAAAFWAGNSGSPLDDDSLGPNLPITGPDTPSNESGASPSGQTDQTPPADPSNESGDASTSSENDSAEP
jgi:preprotein translocase subunit SecG